MIDMAVEIDFLSVFSVGLLSSFSGLFFCLEKKKIKLNFTLNCLAVKGPDHSGARLDSFGAFLGSR